MVAIIGMSQQNEVNPWVTALLWAVILTGAWLAGWALQLAEVQRISTAPGDQGRKLGRPHVVREVVDREPDAGDAAPRLRLGEGRVDWFEPRGPQQVERLGLDQDPI